MDRNLYQKLLVSLKAGERRICTDGAEIAVRSCYDREEGCLDPRTEAAATLTREDFETQAGEIDPELLRNQDKLLGMDNPEGSQNQIRLYGSGWIQRCEVDLYTGGRESRKTMSDIYSRRRLLRRRYTDRGESV